MGDISKYLVSREPRNVTLIIGEDEIKLKVRGIPWSRLNQIQSLNLRWDLEGNSKFDKDGYLRDCLKYMVVEAPWGETTDVFLSQVDGDLGAALEQLVPSAFKSKSISVEEVKKGSSNS